MQIELTLNEEELLKKAADVQISSLHDLYTEGHPTFDEFLDEYGEEYEVNRDDITDELNSTGVDFEIVKMNPQTVFKMNKAFLLAVNFILLHDDWFGKEYKPNARKNLAKKILRIIEVKDMNQTNLN